MRILVLTPSFFSYEQSVAESMRSMGHHVDLVDERPSNSPISRALVRIAPKVLSRAIERHFQLIADATIRAAEYDGLLVIKGEVVPGWFLDEFERSSPRAPRVYYTYDSIVNSPQGVRIAEKFTRRFTFDRQDAESLDGYEYKPLFYSKEYFCSLSERSILLSFVGTLHGDRYRFVRRATEGFAPEALRLFFYVPARWYFWLRRLSGTGFRGVPGRVVNFSPMARADVAAVVRQSRAVLDLQRVGQRGLTMRTFESLASGAALITANPEIQREDFYDPSKILIVDERLEAVDAGMVADFIERLPETPSPPPGFEQYSIDAWVEGIVECFEVERS